MQLSAGMDEGPVYAQQPVALTGDETKFELYEKIVDVSTRLFFDTLPQIINGSLQPTPQDDSKASYSKLIQKSDGVIDWNKSAEQIEREVRTYQGWPQSRTTLATVEVIITHAHVKSGNQKIGEIIIGNKEKISVGTSKDLLSIDLLKPLGKKEMPISAFLSGYGSQLDG